MTSQDFQELASRLQHGESLEQAIQMLEPAGERELLKRCAVVHRFDAGLVDVLRSALPDQPDASLENLIEHRYTEPVPGRNGYYRLPTKLRQEHYERWWSEAPGDDMIPPDLRALSAQLVKYLTTSGADPREVLYHELLVDLDAACVRFEELFEKADREFDLAGCQDLLDVLTERLALLGPEVAELRNKYRARMRARSMWMEDWYRSARFLLPGSSAAVLDDLLEGRTARVLMLWSPGGMGKTSHLRWLIARRCVVDGDVCAYIDFDHVDKLVAMHEPSLLLLEAAAQLDQQLPDAPFHELLAQYPGQRERLRRRSISLAGRGVDGDLIERFAAGLLEVPRDRRVVLLFDTVEEALLLGGQGRVQADLAPFLQQLSSLLARVPTLRVVFAGRYDLAGRVAGFRRLFPRVLTTQLPPLTQEEARAYLTEFRRVTRADVVEEAIQSAGGIPFKLELIADVAEDHPELDAAELKAYANPDLRYVMNRVVERLEPGLQRLLRYGVAPRMLDRQFAEEVLGRWVVDESGPGLDELWSDLKRYAGSASWVTLDPLEPDAVRFHPEVLAPMRALLRADPVHDEVQRQAAEWFARRAELDPSRATRRMREAIYHRFQLEGPAAQEVWSQYLTRARVDRRPDRRRELAAEVLTSDYVDDDGPRQWRSGKTMISRGTLIRARWELAVAAAQIALEEDVERREAEWLEAEQALADIEYLQEPRRVKSVSDAELALLRAQIALGEHDLDQARKHVDRALGGRLTREDRQWLWLAYAAAASAAGRDDAVLQFNTILRSAARDEDSDAHRTDVYLRLAAHHIAHDNLARGVVALDNAAALAEGRQANEVRLERAKMALRLGAPSDALEHLDHIDADEPEIEARRSILLTRTLVAAGRPYEAAQVAFAASQALSGTLESGGPRQRALAAEGREFRGKARAALLDAPAATRDFDDAATRWSRLGANDSVCRCWVRSAELQLRGLGNFREADLRLDQARRAAPARGEDAWRRCTLLAAEFFGATARPERGRALVDDTIAALEARRRPPRAVVMAALQGLALSSDAETENRYLTLLCDELAGVSPPVARLVLLDGLAGCGQLQGDPRLVARLRRLVPSAARARDNYPRLSDDDWPLMALRDAELDRVTGRPDLARRTLTKVSALIERNGALVTNMLPLVASAARAGANDVISVVAQRELRKRESSGAGAILDAAVLLEAARAAADAKLRGELLTRAASILNQSTAPSGRWGALLHELLGDQAEHAGHNDEARESRQLALALYDELGDVERLDRLRERTPGDQSEWVPSLSGGELRVTVELRAALTIETQSNAARSPARTVQVPGRLGDALRRLAATESRPMNPLRELRPLLDDPDALGEELAAPLLDALDGGSADREGVVEVGLRAKDAVIRMLPWELAAPHLEAREVSLFRRAPRARGEPGDVRGVQRALNRLGVGTLGVDGLVGPDTRAAVAKFQSSFGLPPTGEPDPATVQALQARLVGPIAPRVTIVRPSRHAEEVAYRGSRQSGAPVDWLYERAGFAPAVLDAPTQDVLEVELRRHPTAVLHLTVGLVDHHGVPAIDLLESARPKARASITGRLTATAFERLIPRDAPSPLVIIDVPAPPAPHEIATQLLLRNWFAAELMAVGNVRALVATGLAQYGLQVELYEELIGGLRRGCEVGELVRRLQALGRSGEALEAMTFGATALFARRPSIRFPHPAAP